MPALLEKLTKYSRQEPTGCRVWLRTRNSHGYGQMRFNGPQVAVHRLSWIAHHGEIPVGKCVLHKCDNRLCINPEHLFLGSVRDNAIDAARKSRLHNGYPISDVEAVKTLNSQGKTQVQIAAELKITQGQVSKLLNGKRRIYL